ncbi:MAG: NUMOD3 domain-containing DNA-binding protein [Methanogenium sp.]|jgi:hypothetical protein
MPKKGYHQTEEHKRKARVSQREFYANGGLNGFKNKKHTLKTIRKISKSLIGNSRHLGHHHSIEVRLKISNARKGSRLSEEHKRNIGLGNLGRPSPMKGKHHSEESKKKTSEKVSGSRNPMYGKPAPKGSGRGWCGYLDSIYFRSLLELSYLYYLIEHKIKFENAEKRKYRIPYVDEFGTDRTYYADYVIGKEIIEIKPKFAMKFDRNQKKAEAAYEWCKKNGMFYQILNPDMLTKNVIIDLVNNGRIKWTDKTRVKYNQKIIKT